MKKIILTTGLLAGTLDILAAFIQSYLMANVVPSTVLKYIASGVFGKSAYSGGVFYYSICLYHKLLFALSKI